VDDEPDVAELLTESLWIDGHQVDTVNSGAAALDRLLETSYDLVFSDMKMPGIELYEEIARRRPGIERRFIFVTGDNLNATTKQFLDRTGALSVSKPFEIDAIRRLVPLHAVSPGERDSEVALPS
jgi:CheY-like chemotaxis protein